MPAVVRPQVEEVAVAVPASEAEAQQAQGQPRVRQEQQEEQGAALCRAREEEGKEKEAYYSNTRDVFVKHRRPVIGDFKALLSLNLSFCALFTVFSHKLAIFLLFYSIGMHKSFIRARPSAVHCNKRA